MKLRYITFALLLASSLSFAAPKNTMTAKFYNLVTGNPIASSAGALLLTAFGLATVRHFKPELFKGKVQEPVAPVIKPEDKPKAETEGDETKDERSYPKKIWDGVMNHKGKVAAGSAAAGLGAYGLYKGYGAFYPGS